MDIELLQKRFGLMGARVVVGPEVRGRWGRGSRPAGIDIRTDAKGEFFDIRMAGDRDVGYEVIDVRPDLRHLLLLARNGDDSKAKFLCGHDERHWFVCAVPGARVADVSTALAALQPVDVRVAVMRRVRRAKNRLRRRNEAFVRQGEWFFIPEPNLIVNEKLVKHNEPISRGAGSKPHMCQYLHRVGGVPVLVCNRHPAGLLRDQYEQLIARRPSAKGWGWQAMRRGAGVYVRGRVWHPDHKTIVLDGWHRVVMNTEAQAPGRERVVFLD
jgi:hypothetical protein